jgi:6-phosphofructokinase 1
MESKKFTVSNMDTKVLFYNKLLNYFLIINKSGFYSYDWIELTLEKVKDIHHLGGTILGSSRGGFDGNKITDALVAKGINQVYLIGGDGTHKGIIALSEEISRRGLLIGIVGLPKTIDNDIPIIDKSFGFETSVAEA